MKISHFSIRHLLLTLLFPALLCSCVKNEFKVDFEFPKDHIGNYLVTYYAWDSKKGTWIEQTASVQGGVASVPCVTRRPTLVYISDASSPSNSMAIYAERGDEISISGDRADMRTWKVKGNKVSEQWSAWRREATAGETAERKSKRITEFVKGNPSSVLSAIMVLTEYDRRESPDGFVKLWNSIDKDVRTPELIEMCGNPDMLGVRFVTAADGSLKAAREGKLASLALRTHGNGLDTLPLAKCPSFLYFYKDNNTDRWAVIDSLKALVKAYPDSARRIICDVSADTDSMTWVSAIRTDTLKGVVRGWMPRGVADEAMISAGAPRLPWFRVAAKGGATTYSGTDPAKAFAAFRKEMKSK